MRMKVVYQCSGCDNPICDGDRYIKTPYGYFCTDCTETGTAEYKDTEPSLDDIMGNPMEQLNKLSIWG